VNVDPQTFALYTWGYNGKGQLGQNNRTDYSSPVQIPGTTWSSIAAGASSNIAAGSLHTVATKTDNTLWSWGYNTYGNLGQNNRTYYSSPVQIPGTAWSSITRNAALQISS
jgi:alpha-tubulin suppressor-like RCC1 family protein